MSGVLAGLTWTQFKDILPAITFALGLLAGFLGDYLRDKRTSQRDRAKWRAEFTRNTLLELHDAVARLSEKVQVVVRQKESTLQRQGVWPERVQASDEEWTARMDTLRLMVSVEQTDLREGVEELTRAASHAQSETDPQEASATAFAAVGSFIRLNEQIGQALRNVL